MSEKRKCPYCSKVLTQRPYWRHVETEHPEEYANDKQTWINLFNDYVAMGMPPEVSIAVIMELFNQTEEDVITFLTEQGLL
jgi:hypothetical protein